MRNQLRILQRQYQKLFTFYDLDADRYTTATGDITIVERKDN